MPAMISASRSSVWSKLQRSRLAFCCISSAEVATPPALAALPGPRAHLARPVPGGPGLYVGVLPDVAVQRGHEALAEPHDLVVGAALGIEVGPSLATADGHRGQGVLEDLLETQELDDPEVDGGMEPQPALVGSEGAVELNPEPAVDVDLTAIVLPGHPEDDLPLRLADAFDDLVLGELRVLGQHRAERFQHLPHGLVELHLAGVAAHDLVEDGFH